MMGDTPLMILVLLLGSVAVVEVVDEGTGGIFLPSWESLEVMVKLMSLLVLVMETWTAFHLVQEIIGISPDDLMAQKG